MWELSFPHCDASATLISLAVWLHPSQDAVRVTLSKTRKIALEFL